MALLPFFNKYPYTNFEQLNLDWMMEKIGGFDARITDNTEKITVLRTDLTTETNDRIDADNELDLKIAAEAAARLAADNALSGDITAEATARTNADTALSDRITAEVNARTAADTTLQGNIDAEVTARTDADTALTNLINGKFSVVEVTSNQGVWEITSDNWADVFDLTKNVLLHHAQAGIYLLRSDYEAHGNTITAVFSAVDVGVEDVSTTVEGETFNFEDLEYVGGNKFTVTSIDGGESITAITFKNVHTNNVLDLICEDRIAIDALKPVIIELDAGDNNLDGSTTFTTVFDDWDKLQNDNVIVQITTPDDRVIRCNKITNMSENMPGAQFLIDFAYDEIKALNIDYDVGTDTVDIGIFDETFMLHNEILIEYNSGTSSYDVIQGDLTRMGVDGFYTTVHDRTNIIDIHEYRLTGVYRNAGGTGNIYIFSNSQCGIDGATNKPEIIIDQFTFTWNPNTDTYDIAKDSYTFISA